MGTNAVLDVAIGLVLMYLVLSLIGSVLNEYLATLLKLRASTLQNAMAAILDNATLRSDFYDHGLIDGMHQAINGQHVSYLSGQTFALALIGSLDPTKPIPALMDVKTAVENMPDCNIRDVLLAQLATTTGDINSLRNGLAAYFDQAMDRVSGTYKRYLKWISLFVGALIVVALNADSIAVGRALWQDTSLRAEMVQDGSALLRSEQAAGSQNSTDPSNRLLELEGRLRPLPIGWPDKTLGSQGQISMTSESGWFWLLIKIAGFALSALAVSLGAPFWFDTLSKFMNVRGSGTKPERTAV